MRGGNKPWIEIGMDLIQKDVQSIGRPASTNGKELNSLGAGSRVSKLTRQLPHVELLLLPEQQEAFYRICPYN